MDMQKLFAERIGGARFGQDQEVYKFEKIKRAKAQARLTHPDTELLDFGVGEPDRPAPAVVREKLKQAVDDPSNRGYADNGIPAFRAAAADFMKRCFGVDLDPEREINHCIGAKSALAMLPLCAINPGDVVLTTVPGYPVMATHAEFLDGVVVRLPLRRENAFLPDIEAIEDEIARQTKLFYVNYPNNPTGAAATETFFDQLIAFAERHGILIVQDAAYATLTHGQRALSILSRPGGKEVAVEIHSMSKSYNMTGWRLGFVAGNPRAIQAFAAVKDHSDSGQFKAIQLAACEGLARPALAEEIRRHYERRLQKMVEALGSVGFDAAMPGGTFYLYLPAPSGARETVFANAEEASQYLIRECLISTVPWDEAGAYLRFSATFESAGDGDDDRVIEELRRRLSNADLHFDRA